MMCVNDPNPFYFPRLNGPQTSKSYKACILLQLTHTVLDKELKHCRHHEDLEVNENVKFKAKEFVKKYMAKTGATYKRDKEDKQA